jgi:hypothetical protein
VLSFADLASYMPTVPLAVGAQPAGTRAPPATGVLGAPLAEAAARLLR